MHAAMLKLENSTVSFLHWPAARCRCLAAPDDVSLVDHAVPLHGEGAHRDALLGPEVAEAAQPLRGPAGGRPRHREHILRPGHHHHHQLHHHYHLNGRWSDLARLAVRKSAACEARLPPPPGVSRYFSFEVRFVGWSCDLMLWSCHLIIMWSPKFSASLASPLARWMCLALAWCLPGPCCCSVSVSLGTSRISCGAVSPLSSWHKTYSSCYLSSVLSTKSGNKRTFAKFKILQSQRASSWLKAPFSTFILSTDMVRDSILSVRSLVGQFVTHFSSRSKMTFVPGTRFHVYLPFINTCKKGGAISVIVKSLRRIVRSSIIHVSHRVRAEPQLRGDVHLSVRVPRDRGVPPRPGRGRWRLLPLQTSSSSASVLWQLHWIQVFQPSCETAGSRSAARRWSGRGAAAGSSAAPCCVSAAGSWGQQHLSALVL